MMSLSGILAVALLALASLTFGAPIVDQQLETSGVTILAKKNDISLSLKNVLSQTYTDKCVDGVWRNGNCYCSSSCIEKSGVCHLMYGKCSAASKLGSSAVNGLAIAASVVIGSTIDMPISVALVTIAALIPNALAAPHFKMRKDEDTLPTAGILPDVEERSDISQRSPADPPLMTSLYLSTLSSRDGKCVHGSWYDGYCHCSNGCSNIHGVCTNPFGTCSPPHPSSGAKQNLASSSMGALAFAGAAAVVIL